jgi:hypothetical protein
VRNEELDALEAAAKAIGTPSIPGRPFRDAVMGPWIFDAAAKTDCCNLWAQGGDVPLARGYHPDVGAYLAAAAPATVMALVAEVRRLREVAELADALLAKARAERDERDGWRQQTVERAQILGVERDEARAEVARLRAGFDLLRSFCAGLRDSPTGEALANAIETCFPEGA